MKTVLKDWHIVSILEDGELVGKVLWGICVEDETFRFDAGDYVCTGLADTEHTLLLMINIAQAFSMQ